VADPQLGVLYADTSALVKLVIREPESAAVERELMSWERLATSELTAIELPRAVARARSVGRADDAAARLVLEILAAFSAVPRTDDVRALAAHLEPVELRTLDAIHIASALAVGEDLGAVMTYDRRMANAAERLGLEVATPG
jgi:predicted nucleic acid-binding protein